MSRRRADTDDLDSLGLLLDTVCNMFGIFIFAALIVAVIAMTRSTQIIERVDVPADAVLATQQILSTEEALQNLHKRLEEVRGGRTAQLARRAHEAATQVEAAANEIVNRKATLADYEHRLKHDSEFLANLHAEIPKLRDEIARSEDAIRQARQLKEIETRTPLRRALEGRVPVQVVLHEGRAFILNAWWDHIGPQHHPCDIWCNWNAQAVNASASSCRVVKCDRGGEIEIHRRVLLVSGGGIEAKTPLALSADPTWIRFLQSLDPKRHVVSLRCTTTGFDAFGPVRGAIVNRGIPYNVEPARLDPFYSDSIVEGTPIGQ
jgi:hypothetical protein